MDKEFSKRNKKRCESPSGFYHKLEDWSSSDWMVAILGELGEAANIVKKLNRVRDGIRGNKESLLELKEKLISEIADVYIYLDLFCQHENIDLREAVLNAFEKKSRAIGYIEK